MLQILKVSDCYESATNPRGANFEGKQFDELVASIKEKGVLVPVLARLSPLGDSRKYEIIAGNRRFRGAYLAGLKEIPAQVVEMTNDEAREAQIVENLQRLDVHPLEEGEAYRQLIEEGGRTVKDVSVKVGKSEQYVKQRLFLTNLSDKARKLYRSGDMAESVSVLVARLTPNNQDAMLQDRDGRYCLDDAGEARDFIAKRFSEPLKNQPWLTDAAATAAIGACKECPPSRASLFGNVRNGACTDLRCWTRKLKAYFAWRVKQNPDLLLVSTHYSKPDMANVISRSDYEAVKKTSCDFAQQAMVAEGDGLGSMLWVCINKGCEEHHEQKRDYAPTEKEKAKRKKEREQEEVRRVKFDTAVFAALNRVKWPLSEKQFDALYELMFDSKSTNLLMPIVKRHGLKADVKKMEHYTSRDYEAPLRRFAEEGGKEGKLRMIFELLLPTYYIHGDDKEMSKQVAKL